MTDSVEGDAGSNDNSRRPRRRKQPGCDRLPPHSPEAEQGVIGCVLLSPKEAIPLCLEIFRSAEVFYDLRHKTLWDEIIPMYDSSESIDIITLQQRLKDRQLLDQIGGIPYLNKLQDAVPSAANVTYYADIVQEKYILRKLMYVCSDVVGKVFEHTGEVQVLLDEAERDVLSIGQDNQSHKAETTKTMVQKAINTIEKICLRQGTISGLGTGFPDLDRMTDGLHGGEMIVIAARPSMGKTSLAMNIAENVVGAKVPVGVFSLEMSSDQLMVRTLCSSARVNLRQLKEGFLAEADLPKLTSAAGRMSDSPLHIDDTSGLSIMQLRARARRMHQQYGIKLFIIDYLQLLHSTSVKAQENRQHEIAEISGGIKALAKELDVPIIVLAQLNREIEKEKNSRKPKLSDLRESGAIEQDADIVGLLYKPSATEAETEDQSEVLAVNLLIAKQRNGPTGDVCLTFLKGFTRFESAAKVRDEDIPLE